MKTRRTTHADAALPFARPTHYEVNKTVYTSLSFLRLVKWGRVKEEGNLQTFHGRLVYAKAHSGGSRISMSSRKPPAWTRRSRSREVGPGGDFLDAQALSPP